MDLTVEGSWIIPADKKPAARERGGFEVPLDINPERFLVPGACTPKCSQGLILSGSPGRRQSAGTCWGHPSSKFLTLYLDQAGFFQM